jgi:hypothetical protein
VGMRGRRGLESFPHSEKPKVSICAKWNRLKVLGNQFVVSDYATIRPSERILLDKSLISRIVMLTGSFPRA